MGLRQQSFRGAISSCDGRSRCVHHQSDSLDPGESNGLLLHHCPQLSYEFIIIMLALCRTLLYCCVKAFYKSYSVSLTVRSLPCRLWRVGLEVHLHNYCGAGYWSCLWSLIWECMKINKEQMISCIQENGSLRVNTNWFNGPEFSLPDFLLPHYQLKMSLHLRTA